MRRLPPGAGAPQGQPPPAPRVAPPRVQLRPGPLRQRTKREKAAMAVNAGPLPEARPQQDTPEVPEAVLKCKIDNLEERLKSAEADVAYWLTKAQAQARRADLAEGQSRGQQEALQVISHGLENLAVPLKAFVAQARGSHCDRGTDTRLSTEELVQKAVLADTEPSAQLTVRTLRKKFKSFRRFRRASREYEMTIAQLLLSACQVLTTKGLLRREATAAGSTSQPLFHKVPVADHSEMATACRAYLTVSVTAFPA